MRVLEGEIFSEGEYFCILREIFVLNVNTCGRKNKEISH